MRSTTFLTLVALLINAAQAFTSPHIISNQQHIKTQLSFGIPSFLTPKSENEKDDKKTSVKKEEKKIGWKGLLQLITAGAGSPFLGDYEGIDKETGAFMFSLEANNLYDENGTSKQTSMPYFESGWVDAEDEKKANEGFKFPWQK